MGICRWNLFHKLCGFDSPVKVLKTSTWSIEDCFEALQLILWAVHFPAPENKLKKPNQTCIMSLIRGCSTYPNSPPPKLLSRCMERSMLIMRSRFTIMVKGCNQGQTWHLWVYLSNTWRNLCFGSASPGSFSCSIWVVRWTAAGWTFQIVRAVLIGLNLAWDWTQS